MDDLSPKERLFRVLQHKTVDRPPVICTGGMMNAAVIDVMELSGQRLPAAHHDGAVMANLSEAVGQYTGFENLGLPFCMTVEAEILGSKIDFGSLSCEPKIAKEKFSSVSQVEFQDMNVLKNSGRLPVLAKASALLAKKHPDVPVIGSLTGPMSTAASIVDPITFLKELRKDRDHAHRVIDYISRFLGRYAELLVENGASIIAIGDPTATGEILGPKMFDEYAVFYLNQIIREIHHLGVPVILHICGDMKAVKHLIPKLESDAISMDALVNLRLLKEEFTDLITMGNLSTYLLQFGTAEKVAEQIEKLLEDRIDIISPACGLSTSSALSNIHALTETVKESR